MQVVLTSAIIVVSAVLQASAAVTPATAVLPASLSVPMNALDKVAALREDACASQGSLALTAQCQGAVVDMATVMFLALANVTQDGVVLSAASNLFVQIPLVQAMVNANMDPVIATLVGMGQGAQHRQEAACLSAAPKVNVTCIKSNASARLATWGPTAIPSSSPVPTIAITDRKSVV